MIIIIMIYQPYLPISAEPTKITIRQFNFELTFNGLIFKGNGLSQCSL